MFGKNAWSSNQDSPYLPHAKFFIDDLTITLFDLGIIQKTTYTEVKKIIFPSSTRKVTSIVSNLRYSPKSPSRFKVGEQTIDRCLIRIENEINKKFNKSQQSFQQDAALSKIRNLMNSIYSLFGYTHHNPFYRDARLILLRMGEILRSTGLKSFETNDFAKLSSFIGRNITYVYDSRRKYDFLPETKSIIKLTDDIKTALEKKTEFSKSKINNIKNQINAVAQVYIDKIQDYHRSEDIFNNFRNGPMKILLQEIVDNASTDILKKIKKQTDLEDLLFGSKSMFLSQFLKYDEKYLRSLLDIKFKVEKWTIQSFKDISILISKVELDNLKIYISETIDRWIFNNPYQEFIKKYPRRFGVSHTKDFLKPEYKVIYNIYKAFRIHKNSNISFNEITSSIKSTVQLSLSGERADHNIGSKTLKKYLNKLNEFESDAQSNEEAAIYQETIKIIKDYTANRLLALNTLSDPRFYSDVWFQHWYKSTLIILKLVEFGGINPISFNPLNPEMFDRDMNTGLFQPHHINPSKKHLLQFNGVILINSTWHGRFNALSMTEAGIRLQEQLRDCILELMRIDRDVTEKDIKKTFGDLSIFDKKVSDWWIENPLFNELLDRWNEHRRLIRESRVFEFIQNNFILDNGDNPVIDRFWRRAIETFHAFSILYEDYDLSYLFTEADKQFIIRYFKLKDL